MPPAEPLQIFLHIPKAAGSTLQAIIYNNFRPEEIFWVNPDGIAESLQEFAELSAEAQAGIRLLGGHITFGVHELAKRPCRYFTMLRDPVERIISMYHYIQSDASHFLHREVGSMAFRDFVKGGFSAQFDNGQTRLLAETLCGNTIGSLEREDYKACSAASLKKAKQNLRERIAVAGISEKFNASLLLFQQAFGWRRLAYIKKNVARSRPASSALDPETLHSIAEANRFDLALYAEARELLEKKTAAQGLGFRLKLRFFNLSQAWRS